MINQTKRKAAKVWLPLGAAMIVGLVGLGGCAGSQDGLTGDPLTDIRNPNLSVQTRIDAAQRARVLVGNGGGDRVETRKVLKDVAWTQLNPTELRLAALEEIFGEPGMEADSRSWATLRLPLETGEAVVSYIADVAVERGWAETTPALVRCLARRESGLTLEQRPEAMAIVALHPDRALSQTVLDVFLSPGDATEVWGISFAELTRADAWDLLAKLDADGTLRAGLLESESYESLNGESAKLRDDLRACYAELHTLPLNASELIWLSRLREPRHALNEAWWAEAARAVAIVSDENRFALRLRHIEPIRWAAAHHPQWLSTPYRELFSLVQSRLDGRQLHRRSDRARESDPLLQERLGQGAIELKWADLLTILVIDEALGDEGVRASLFRQAELDFEDKTTEYGGTLSAGSSDSAGGGMHATLFAPRPASRIGDERFVASADMLRSSDRTLAHYHFHVQRWGNARFAGPSPDDRVYAWRQGRACLVVTGIRKGVLAVDYYQPDGLILDLGEIRQP